MTPCTAIGPHHDDKCDGGRVQAPNAQFMRECEVCRGTGHVPVVSDPREQAVADLAAHNRWMESIGCGVPKMPTHPNNEPLTDAQHLAAMENLRRQYGRHLDRIDSATELCSGPCKIGLLADVIAAKDAEIARLRAGLICIRDSVVHVSASETKALCVELVGDGKPEPLSPKELAGLELSIISTP